MYVDGGGGADRDIQVAREVRRDQEYSAYKRLPFPPGGGT